MYCDTHSIDKVFEIVYTAIYALRRSAISCQPFSVALFIAAVLPFLVMTSLKPSYVSNSKRREHRCSIFSFCCHGSATVNRLTHARLFRTFKQWRARAII